MSRHRSREQTREALRQAPLFAALSDGELRALALGSRVMDLRAGERVWRRGDRATTVGLVLAGRLKLVRPSAREVVVDVAVPGDIVGEIAFVTGTPLQHDLTCLRLAHVLLLPAANLRSLLSANSGVALALASDLARQMIRLTNLVEDLSSRSVESRLARVLLRLAERTGEPFPGGTLIPLRLRRADLAAMTATTLESVSRRISIWQRRGWIVAQPAGYLLRDIPALTACVNERDSTRS